MEAWRQWQLGRRKNLVQRKTKRILLTPTGLLMEGGFHSETRSVSEIEMFQQGPSSLAAGRATADLEVAGLRPATAESQFIGAISPVFKIAFNVFEYDIAGQSLFASLLRTRASEGPVFDTNPDAFVDGPLSDVHFQIGIRNFPFAAAVLLK